MIQLKLEGNRVYPVENTLRTLSKLPCYLVWALFDCDRKERDEDVYAGIGEEEWDDNEDGR